MKGAKRFAVSDSVPDSNDTALRNKRITEGFLFDVHRPEPSQQQLTPLPPLDVKRAESSQLHVRALNNQFASWVQTQLKNHPDELWEDGIRDYLAHASNIMEKFSDVVNWLKANAAKGVSVADSLTTEKKSVPEIKNNERKLLEEKTGFALPSTSARFTSSRSSSVFSANQSSGGVSSSSQSSSLFSNGESSGPTNLSSGLFSNNQSSGFFSNSQSFGLSSNNQSSGSLSSSQSTGAFSNSQTPFSINQSTGAFSNSQTPFSINQSTGAFSNSQTPFSSNQIPGAFSNSQTPFSINQSTGAFSNSQTPFSINQSTGALSNSQSAFSFNQSSAAFSERQSIGVFSNSQTPFSFGGQSSIPTTHNTADDADDENELQQPGSPSVKKSEEKGIVTVHEVKCKLYVKSSDPAVKDTWKDKGTGQLSIKCKEGISKGTKESKPTIVIRNDVGKVLLNALLYPGIKTNPQKNSLVAIFHTAGDDSGNNDCVVARTFLFRMKTEEDRNKLATAIQEYAPST